MKFFVNGGIENVGVNIYYLYARKQSNFDISNEDGSMTVID